MNKWTWLLGSIVASQVVGCGGSDTGTATPGSASSSLDGAWDIVFTGGPYQTGTLSISGATGILALAGTRCSGHENISMTLSSDGAHGDGTDDCESPFTVTKSSNAVSAFGGIGGTWSYGTASTAACSMTITGSTFDGSCQKTGEVAGFLVGNITGTLATDGKTLAGHSTESGGTVQFAATRR